MALSKYAQYHRSAPPVSATHVLAWEPAYMYRGETEGRWSLQTSGYFTAGLSCGTPGDWYADYPRGAYTAHLAHWVRVRLGYPVTLTLGEQQIKPWGRLARYCTEPVYYVSPVS
jgi:hypothetical protein